MFTALPQPLSETEPPPLPEDAARIAAGLLATKRLIWLYFWLLIFEGALRKWIFPGLSNPLLLVRDPIVILIYVSAGMAGLLPRNGIVFATIGLGAVSFICSELGGEGNLLVSLFGVRTNFLHLPLIFLLPSVFDKQDMERMGRWLLISSIPMCLLVLAQFRASPDSWLNNGAGGSQNGQLESAFGRIRPPGTFSFTAGLVSYLGICSAFAMQTLMQQQSKNLRLATAALPALAIMLGVSGSRAALGSVALICAAVAFVCIKKPAYFGGSMKLVIIGGAAYFALGSWSEFQQGMEVHRWRFEGSGGWKDGFLIRFFGDLLPINAISHAPFLGRGLGMGTNAASNFLFGRTTFSLGESEWDRVIGESGPLLGLAFIGLRVAILVYLTIRAFEALKHDAPLPLLLLAAAFPQILNGQFGVPMLLGWAVFSGALCLAATNVEAEIAPLPAPVADTPEMYAAAKSFRGRSIYADQLHGEFEDPDIARFGP